MMMATEIMVWADGTADSEAYYSARHQGWVFVDHFNHQQAQLVSCWVEVALEAGDPEGLNQACIACDMEGEGRWVLSGEGFIALDSLEVTAVGTVGGEVLTTEEDIARWISEAASDAGQ